MPEAQIEIPSTFDWEKERNTRWLKTSAPSLPTITSSRKSLESKLTFNKCAILLPYLNRVTTIQGRFIISCLKIQQWFIICMASCRYWKECKNTILPCKNTSSNSNLTRENFNHHLENFDMQEKKPRCGAPHFYLLLKLFSKYLQSVPKVTLEIVGFLLSLQAFLLCIPYQSKWIITFTFPSSSISIHMFSMSKLVMSWHLFS